MHDGRGPSPGINGSTRDGIAEAVAAMRAKVWRRLSATTGTARVVLDIDASLVEVHSENNEVHSENNKEQAEPTF